MTNPDDITEISDDALAELASRKAGEMIGKAIAAIRIELQKAGVIEENRQAIVMAVLADALSLQIKQTTRGDRGPGFGSLLGSVFARVRKGCQ